MDTVKYYSLITVHNNAGGWQTAYSDGFRIDVSPPDCGSIYDGPGYDRAYIGRAVSQATAFEEDGELIVVGDMKMAWTGFFELLSEISGYAASIVPSAKLTSDLKVDPATITAKTVNFTHVGLAGSIGFFMRLVHNERYYSVVSVWDGLGNEQKCYSNGVLYDDTPPNTTLAFLASHLGKNERNIQKIAHLVHAEVRGIFDSESGVRQYFAAIGSSATEVEDIAVFRSIGTSEGKVLIGGLSIPDGPFFVTVRAYNNAMDSSDVSIAAGVDTVQPFCSPIAIWNNEPGQKFQYTETVDRLEATWECKDNAPWAHIAIDCEWSVGSFPGGDDVMPWTAAQASGTHAWADAKLENGFLYFVQVRLCVGA